MPCSCNLEQLLQNDPQANIFFNELPDYVREMIQSRGNHVCSFDDLKSYADNLLSGDK